VLRRRRWDFPKNFLVSSLQLVDLAHYLVLTGGEPLDGFSAVFSGPASGLVEPSCWTQLAITCFASGDQPSFGALVAIICLVASP